MAEDTWNRTDKTSGIVLAGFIISIIAILGAWVPIVNNISFVFAVISLILGIIGLSKIKKGKSSGKGLATATIIISVLACVLVLATQALFSEVADDVSESINESVSDYDGSNTDKLLEESVDVTLGAFIFDGGEEAEYTYDDTTKLPVTITNKSDENASFSVKVEAVDANGSRITEDTVYVSDLTPGQSQTLDAFQYVESDKVEALQTATFKVLSVTR